MSFNKGGDGRPRGFGFSGFQLKKDKSNQLPPPPSSAISKHGYSTMSAISQNALAASYGLPRKRAKTEEEYFEEDDDHQASPTLEYIPAPGSPSNDLNKGNDSDSDEVDPLDAFMVGIEQQVKKQITKKSDKPDDKKKGIRDDIEDEDVEESYYRYMEENPNAGLQAEDSDQEIEYDEDGNPIAPKKSKTIDPLPPIDHSTIKYSDFEKNFYVPHDEIAALDTAKVYELLSTLGIKVTGPDPPKPAASFAHFGFDEHLMKQIRKSDYTQPTPIQSQAVPAALAGRDIIGIAKTGSGKTAAFVWPMLVHLMDQAVLAPGDGPIGLILAPTRELSQQIYTEAKRFGKVYNIRVCCCYGGGSKWEQSKALEGGAEIVVATPGRMIDMVKMGATNLTRVTFLVLDEADRMFDMGFEPQVRSICNHVRPDRQTLLFSATFKRKIERLARDVTIDPVRIVQGDVGEANTDVTQIIKMISSPQAKFTWLLNSLVEFLSTGSVLIFVGKKANAEELANSLTLKELDILLLHGDIDQVERNKVITRFKKKEVPILVATDVAARGLDIPHIKTVVNYDVARDVDTHTHRIGRTGRAGQLGTAYTLVTDKDKEFAGHLVRNLEGAAQEVPQALLDLAMTSSWFRKSRFKGGRGKGAPAYKERPGLGSSTGKPMGVAASSTAAAVAAATAAASAAGGKTGGPGSDRLSAMKAAFRSQYQTQFTASSDHTWEQTLETEAAAAAAAEAAKAGVFKPPEPRKQKKSRWDSSDS